MDNEKVINELINISKEKKLLMNNILDLTKRQKKFLELEKIQTILKQIDLKDKYMAEIDKLDMRFYSLFNELKSKLGIDTMEKIDIEKYPQVKELKKIVSEIVVLTKEIQKIDNENIANVRKDMGEMSNKLRGVRQGRKVSNAYGAYKKQVTSIFMDKKK